MFWNFCKLIIIAVVLLILCNINNQSSDSNFRNQISEPIMWRTTPGLGIT